MSETRSEKGRCRRVLRALARLTPTVAVLGLPVFILYLWIPATTHYHVTERYGFEPAGADVPVFLAVLVPHSDPCQRVESLKVAWGGTTTTEQKGAVDVLKMEGTASKISGADAVVDYDVILFQGAVYWKEPFDEEYLLPETDVESDAPEIAAAAARIAQGTSREDVREIYNAVGKSVYEPRGARPQFGGRVRQSALEALRTGEGVCGDSANLMTALCRARGIPARSITGLAFLPYPPYWPASTRVWNHPGIAHAWVEFCADGGSWEPADPTMAGIPILAQFAFGRTDGAKLSYGESGEYTETYDEADSWVKSMGTCLAAMSNPLAFSAGAASKDVKCVPSVTVKKGWDGRWAAMIAVVAAIQLVRWGLRKRRKAAAARPGDAESVKP